MAAATYEQALRLVLGHEGGYSNHPSDPGGPTNFGITIYDYRKYIKPDATAADVRIMLPEQAKQIYRAKYWDALRCDELPAGLDYAVFDYGVNSGIGRSGIVLRRLLKLPDTSSAITDDVIAAARRANAAILAAALCDERLAFLQRLKTWPVFGNGWARRVAEVKAKAIVLAGGHPQYKQRSSAVKTGAFGAIAAASGAASYAGGLSALAIAAIIAAVAAVAVAAWFFWRHRQKHHRQNITA